MTEREQGREKQQGKWTGLDSFLQKLIKETSRSVASKGLYARDEVKYLNAQFAGDGLIASRVRIEAAAPIITGKMLTATGVLEESDIDLELLQEDFIEGEFIGCEVMTSRADATQAYLVYTLGIDKGTYDAREVRALVEDAELSVRNIEKDEDDEVIIDAFDSLDTIKELNFQEDLAELRAAFWDTSGDLTKRARVIGVLSTVLMAHPDANEAIEEAIGVIVLYSLEEGTSYRINGIRTAPAVADDGTELVEVDAIHGKRILQFDGMIFVDDFELQRSLDGREGVVLSDGLQPAYVFTQQETGAREVYPLRFISQLNEEEFVSGGEGAYEVATRRYGGDAEAFMTCGEHIRAYDVREKDAGDTAPSSEVS